MKAFKTLNTKEYELSVVQDNISNALSPVLKVIILDGQELTSLNVTTTDTIYPHLLNRIPLGWFITDKNANINVWRVTWDSRTITLQASGSGPINLWIY